MPIKKSELYSSLWKSCDELRGGMDASQYKDYVLILLFVKYVSDKYAGRPDALIEIPEGAGFADMAALKGDKEIGDKINKIIARLAEANDLRGVIDVADFNDSDKLGSGKDMQDRLSKLVAIFENPALDFSRNRAEGDDILGDAYEYLMRHFATESGKSKGQFYTPAEVSRIMAKVIEISRSTSPSQTIYDPACGSGSLLLKAADESKTGVTIYGQEMDNATAALARMNMILHNNATAEVWKDNTLSSPHFKEKDGSLKTFDFVVANPPFSNKAWTTGFDPAHDIFGRFADGIPPEKNGDFAFLLHIIRSLKSSGRGAAIMPHGVLFRGNAEAIIRRNIIRKGYIKGIIGLPANLFYGTGIPACIIVLDKENAAGRTGIFMIDASKGFVKDGNKNRLRHQDIHKIVDVFNKQIELPKYARLVSLAEIEANDYNLNIPRYIDSTEPEDRHDIEAHLLGGIPDRDIEDLSFYWQVFPTLRQELFEAGARPGYSQTRVGPSEVKQTIFSHPEFAAYTNIVNGVFEQWRNANSERLKSITVGSHPKELIEQISESLLAAFTQVPLIDPYDIYQHMMSYWSQTMQDDVYVIAMEAWIAGNDINVVDPKKERAEFAVGKQKYKGAVIPAELIVARYFADEQSAIEQLEEELAAITRRMEELAEEHGGEEGLLAEVTNEKGKISKANIAARMKVIKGDSEAADERALLGDYMQLIEQEASAASRIGNARGILDEKIRSKYPALSEEEVQSLIVEDKWLAALAADVHSEMDRVSHAITGRIRQLVERYAAPLPELDAKVEELGRRVERHLERMGFVYNEVVSG